MNSGTSGFRYIEYHGGIDKEQRLLIWDCNNYYQRNTEYFNQLYEY